jgi:hypothetical protein
MAQPRQITRKGQGFTLEGNYVRGVVPTNQRLFYHNYSYGAAVHGPQRQTPEGATLDPNRAIGFERGRKVDDQISRAMDVMAACHLEPAWMVEPKKYTRQWRKVNFTSVKDETWIKSLVNNMHPFTQTFFKLMVSRDWLPYSGQMLCASNMARLGTAIDAVVVARSAPRTHILLELKSGYYKYLFRHCGRMNAPFTHLTDCPLNQFYLQLAVGRLLYGRTYPNQKQAPAFVVVLHEFGRDIHELPVTVTREEAGMWRRLLDTRDETKTQRAAELKHHKARQFCPMPEVDSWKTKYMETQRRALRRKHSDVFPRPRVPDNIKAAQRMKH